jgi:hypothetical protein
MAPLFRGKAGIFDTVVQFFEEDDWNFQEFEGKTILKMGFSGSNASWTCYAHAKDEEERFTFYSIMESKVPANKRAAIAEYLTRANYGLVIGNLEMDYSDGEVRYKTSIDVEGGQLTSQMIKTMVYVNVLTMDKYLPGIMSVIFAEVSPVDAIAKIES